MPLRLARLLKDKAIVGANGLPTPDFMIWWQRFCEAIEANDAANDALDASQSAALDILDETVAKADACYNQLGPGEYVITASQTLAEDCRSAWVNATGGAVTVTLLPVSGRLSDIVVKKIDASANAVTVDADGAETIDGGATTSLTVQWQSVTLRPRSSGGWYLV